MIGLSVNWGSCLLGIAFDDDNHTLNFYLGPFCLVIGGGEPPVRHG